MSAASSRTTIRQSANSSRSTAADRESVANQRQSRGGSSAAWMGRRVRAKLSRLTLRTKTTRSGAVKKQPDA